MGDVVKVAVYGAVKLALQKLSAVAKQRWPAGAARTIVRGALGLLHFASGWGSATHLAVLLASGATSASRAAWSAVGGVAWFCALHLLGRRLVRPPPLPARVVEQQTTLMSKAERWKQLDAERQAAARRAPDPSAPGVVSLEASIVCGLGAGGWDGRNMLGEGPMWSPHEGALLWVDCSGSSIHRYDPKSDSHTVWSTPEHIGCLVLTDGRGIDPPDDGPGLAAAVVSGFVSVTLPPGGGKAITSPLCPLDQDTGDSYDPGLGFDPTACVRGMNDGKVDRKGRFWAGSVLTPKGMSAGKDAFVGKLWRLEPRTVGEAQAVEVLPHVGCSQGPAWSPCNATMYHTDSAHGVIHAYDFDYESGEISNRRVFCSDFGLEEGVSGGPDGLTVDSEGYVWSAVWGGSKVVR